MMKPLTLCITGSTDGIGLAAAKRFARAGHRVIVHGRSASRIGDACTEIVRVTGVEPFGAVEANFTDLDAVCLMGRELVERFPDLDLLINNAAVCMPTRTLVPEGYETVMEITRNGQKGEYFENLRPVRYSPVAGDAFARLELAELTGEMLRRFGLGPDCS